MGWGMCDTKQSYETTFWGEVLRTALDYEKDSESPYGLYWLISLHYLLGDSIEDLQNHLPEKHPLKLVSLNLKGLDNLLKPRLNGIKQNFNITKIKKIDFSGLPFDEEMNFSDFIFPIDTDFSKAKFSKNVFFNNAVFCETADFEDTEFQTEKSYCKETAKFRNTTFSKIANFRNTIFWGYANFKGAKLAGRAFFQKAKFKWHAPRFYDATFNNEMTWAGIELPKFAEAKVDRYKKVGDEFKPDKCDGCTECARCVERAECVKCAECAKCKALIKQNRRRRIEENQNSYENTVILLKKQGKYHDQHFFFRQEMQCRRRLEGPFNFTTYGIYEYLANYGYGVGRALFGWLVHILIGAGILFGLRYFNCFKDFTDDFGCSLGISLSNSHAFFFKDDRLVKCYKAFETLPWFNVVWGVQTITGTLLIFLVLLTLRIRFRLK